MSGMNSAMLRPPVAAPGSPRRAGWLVRPHGSHMLMSARRSPKWNGHPIPYGAPVQELERRLTEPGPAAWTAMIALADDPSPEAFAVLLRCAGSPDWTFRRLALEAIS